MRILTFDEMLLEPAGTIYAIPMPPRDGLFVKGETVWDATTEHKERFNATDIIGEMTENDGEICVYRHGTDIDYRYGTGIDLNCFHVFDPADIVRMAKLLGLPATGA